MLYSFRESLPATCKDDVKQVDEPMSNTLSYFSIMSDQAAKIPVLCGLHLR